MRFDTQKLDNPEINGVEYQQGTLLGYEVREYLLEKWGRECAYCGTADTPLEIEHVIPRSRGGSNRVSNLTLSCHPCNQSKDALSLVDFFATDKGLKKRLKANGHTANARPSVCSASSSNRCAMPARSMPRAGRCLMRSKRLACRWLSAPAVAPSTTASDWAFLKPML
ncbi:hypothetical protein HAALTHF_31920n [Vreelandella aquamarina]|nr:hypothetical protein HAALTHF_31920n [Halomonas axialensis]